MTIEYESTYTPAKEKLNVIEAGLDEYNESKIGKHKRLPVASFAKDADGNIIGGVYGCLFWDWLYIDWMWVKQDFRNQKIGANLLKNIEDLALHKGIDKSFLCTASFQSLEFYLKNGYVIFGQQDDMPKGHTEYYMRKHLQKEEAYFVKRS